MTQLQDSSNRWHTIYSPSRRYSDECDLDRQRQAVLLIEGNKRGDKRWYDKNIPIADRRFTEYLEGTNIEISFLKTDPNQLTR